MPTTYTVVETKRSGHRDERGVRFYTREFMVISSDQNDGPAVIARQVPYSLWESYPIPGEEDEFAILKKVDTQPTPTLGVWTVTLDYDSDANRSDRGTARPEHPDQSPKKPGENANDKKPEDRPWVLKWGSVRTTKLLRNDRSGQNTDPFAAGYVLGTSKGKLVATSAGQLFDPAIEVPESHPTLSITAFSSTAAANNVAYWVNRVNDAPWMGWPRDTARCTDYGITSQYEEGRFTFQIDVSIEFNIDGWNPVRVLDAGTFYKFSKSPVPLDADGKPIDNSKLVAIPSSRDGSPVTSPVPLDGNGQPLKNGAEFVYLEFQGYYRGRFTALLRQDLGARRKYRA